MKDFRGGVVERLLSYVNAGDESGAEASVTTRQIKEFIDEIPGGFLIYSAEKGEKILYANKSLLAIFRCATYAEFIEHTGGSFRGVVHPDDLNEVESSIKEQIKLSPDDLDYVEYRIICKDGTERRVEDYGHFAHTDMGDVYYVFLSDATEKINTRLREHLQRLEIIEGLSINYDSILYFDLERDTVIPYRSSSRTSKQFEGDWHVKTYKGVIDDYVKSWVYEEDRESVLQKLNPDYVRRMMADEQTYYFDYRCVQNGEIIYLQLRIANVSKDGKADKFVLGFKRIDEEILREIKQKQFLEEALKAANVASVAKNAFLSNMSHDMRTPLNAIFGYIALARRNLNEPEEVNHYLGCVEEAGKQILDLTAKVLEVSDIETQDYVTHEAPCDLCELLHEVYESTRAQAQKKNLLVTLNTTLLEHHNVIADGEKIKSVLTYITSNAVKYNKPDGRIDIIAEEKPHDDSARSYGITVRDTGVGINKDALEKIFAPFEREYDTTESGVSGVGLGLTIAKHNAEIMGGNITVESVKGEGSAFTLNLNLKIVKKSSKVNEEKDDLDLKGVKILLVEDNEINLEIETDILQDEGFIVDTAENGQIAVDKIKNSPEDEYRVILMDIQMPVMDGRQASECIRALGGKRAEIPIIALSANAFERDKRLSLEHGMNAHLTKPMELEIIVKTMRELLNVKK